ncbi:MAG TPA: hypothetical protein VMW83_09860 [Spirochaetia bacterium]|nr:hypothetical protein [Spirochaetia bacterium]
MKRRTTVFLILVCAVAAILAVIYWSHKTAVNTGAPAPAAKPPSSSTPAVTPPAVPKVTATDPYKLVGLYFSSLKDGDFPGAYAYFSPDLRKTLTYQAFVAGFKGSSLTSFNSSSPRVVGAGNISLVVQVPYTLSGTAGDVAYTATLRCVNITPGTAQADWRVESLSSQRAGAASQS